MAKRGGGDVWTVLAFVGGVALLTYFARGKGKNNSPFIPDAIEDK